ncbi:MAG: RidA family protein [Vulcanimicrobiaceae bacterium]
MERTFIEVPHEKLPPRVARKPFSDAVRVGDTLYISGRIGLDATTGQPPEDAASEARLLMENLRAVLEAAEMSMNDLVQIHIFTPDVTNYETFNAVYLEYFGERLPARAFIGSGQLLFGARFELTAIAVRAADD